MNCAHLSDDGCDLATRIHRFIVPEEFTLPLSQRLNPKKLPLSRLRRGPVDLCVRRPRTLRRSDELSYSVTHFSYLLHEFGDLADRQHVRPLEARIGANHPVELSQLTNTRCVHLVEVNSTLAGDDGERVVALASGLNIIHTDGAALHLVGELCRVVPCL